MATKHTPGPWKFAHGQDDLLTGPDGNDVVCVDVHIPSRPKEEQQANLRVIRLAPELLAALERVSHFLELDRKENVNSYAQRARLDVLEAIAKAKGQD